MNDLADLFNHQLYVVITGIVFVLPVIGFIIMFVKWVLGITPLVFRLGMALSKRKVAIFSTAENFESLKSTLVESNLFKAKNILHIKKDNIERAKEETLFLVDWRVFEDKIDQVFAVRKNYHTAVLIYAKPGTISQNKMDDITDRSNTVVVNSRGRLLNDVLTALITTSYRKK